MLFPDLSLTSSFFRKVHKPSFEQPELRPREEDNLPLSPLPTYLQFMQHIMTGSKCTEPLGLVMVRSSVQNEGENLRL